MNDDVQQDPATTLELLRQQHSGAFTRLVREMEPMIAGLCQMMGLRDADLDDATAEAFAEVYRSLPRFDGRSSVGTWAYRIATRVIWRVRTERGRREHASLHDGIAESHEITPADQLAQDDESREIWRAVASLEDRQATAVELYYRRDCTIDEIAERLGCPPNTVKTLLHRARAILRETLKHEVAP